MGSPDSENWRIGDETLHEVTVSAFYIDPYEALQSDYEALMGDDPGTFDGEGLPVDNISWLEAVQYANERSNAAGLTPAYTIGDGEVVWDRSANGYRLPTESTFAPLSEAFEFQISYLGLVKNGFHLYHLRTPLLSFRDIFAVLFRRFPP